MNVAILKEAEIELQSTLAKMRFNGEHRALNLAIIKVEEGLMWLQQQIEIEEVL